jgi:hypothetical protein
MNRRQFLEGTCLAGTSTILPGFPAAPGSEPRNAEQAPIAAEAGSETEIFVAVDGDDRNRGTNSEPFATVGRAVEAVRALRKQTSNPLKVWVRAGTYYLPEPIVFGPLDSGREHPIVYAAYPGERVTLSGGKRLECRWKLYRDGIMMCDLPEAQAGRLDFTQLFVNGKRQIRARFPNYDSNNPLVSGSGYINAAGKERDWPVQELPYDPETFTQKRWARPQDAVVHVFNKYNWGNLQWKVDGVDWDNHVIKLGWGGFQLNQSATLSSENPLGPTSRFFVENVLEELDAPGEWYLDKANSLLYYLPAEGIDLKVAVIEVPVLEQVVEFRGAQLDPVRQITLSGFRIAHTASTYLAHYEAPSRGDWNIHRGGAVFIEGAEDCRVEKCFFDAVGGNGVFINDYNRRITVYGSKFVEAGDSAVCLVGSKKSIQGTQHPYPAENTVTNNLIHDCGIFGKQIAGVFISISAKNTVSHNHIYNLPRAGICLNDGWAGGHIIEFNKIHHTVLETKDHGPFNSWGRESFWCLQQSHYSVSHGAGEVKDDTPYVIEIRNNFFQDDHEWGIDLDDGSSNTHVYNNVCVGMSVKLREGDYRLVENNIFVHPANPPGFHVGYEYNHDRFIRNIIVTSTKFDRPALDINFTKGAAKADTYQVIFPPLKGHIMQEIDYNVFFNDIGEFHASILPRGSHTTVRHTLEEWRAMGFDKHSVYADPLFVDSGKGDYRLKPDSPALSLGFKNFDVSAAGLLPDFPEQWK